MHTNTSFLIMPTLISFYPNRVGADGQVAWGELAKLLVSEGETIATGDLEAYLEALVGRDGLPEAKDEYDGYRFTDHVLGFEE
jgi:hypothetical protein